MIFILLSLTSKLFLGVFIITKQDTFFSINFECTIRYCISKKYYCNADLPVKRNYLVTEDNFWTFFTPHWEWNDQKPQWFTTWFQFPNGKDFKRGMINFVYHKTDFFGEFLGYGLSYASIRSIIDLSLSGICVGFWNWICFGQKFEI